MNFVGTATLMTPRLLLRKFCIEDVDAMYCNWASDPNVTQYLTWDYHKNQHETEQVVTSWMSRYNNPDFYLWCIEYRPEQKPIGSIGIVTFDVEKENARIGYCLSSHYWNKGIMSEALATVVRFLFCTVGFRTIMAYHHPLNIASGKVMAHVGMKPLPVQADNNAYGYAIHQHDYVSQLNKGLNHDCSKQRH